MSVSSTWQRRRVRLIAGLAGGAVSCKENHRVEANEMSEILLSENHFPFVKPTPHQHRHTNTATYSEIGEI